MWCYFLFYALFLVSASSDNFDSTIYKTVNTNSGSIRGRLNQTLLQEKQYFAFKGIPYAEPPIDQLRFKAPQQIEPWPNNIDAFEYGTACPQLDGDINFSETSEDCLFLNIFVPRGKSLFRT